MNSGERLELAKARIIQAMTGISKDFNMDAYVTMLVAEAALYEFRKAIDLQLAQNATMEEEAS